VINTSHRDRDDNNTSADGDKWTDKSGVQWEGHIQYVLSM